MPPGDGGVFSTAAIGHIAVGAAPSRSRKPAPRAFRRIRNSCASPGALTGLVEETQLHTFRDLGEQGEIRAPSVPRRTKRVRRSRPDTHSPPSYGEPGRVRAVADSTG